MSMGITDVLGGFYGSRSELYGRKPIVPPAPDYSAALQKIIQGNISALPGITELAGKATELYKDLLEKAQPGFAAMTELAGKQITAGLHGEVPQDVADQIARFDAEKAAEGGYSGSPAQRNLTARDLGLTSLDLIQKNLSAAERWTAAAQGRTFDFSKMFLGPDAAMHQADAQFNRDWLQSQVTASPDPGKRGAFDSEMALLGMVLSAYGGGAGYQNTYRPSYGGGGGNSFGSPEAEDARWAKQASYFDKPDYSVQGGSNSGGSYDFNQNYNEVFGGVA